MIYKKYRILVFLASVFLILTSFNLSAGADENNEEYGDPGPIYVDITEYYKYIVEPGVTDSYILIDNYGGYWCDAEKLPPDDGEGNPDPWNANEEDDLLCWAATAANILEWTGWGFVGSMEDTDDFMQHFEDHWYDGGGWMDYAWHWWFDGTDPGSDRIDVGGAGNYWPGYTYSNYYHVEGDDPEVPERIHDWLQAGYGCGIGIFPPNPPGGHAITVWGIEWDDDDDDYYTGMWVSDSDSHKGMANPPDIISYIQLEYDDGNNRWYMPNYGNWWISEVQALEPFPDNTRPVADAGGPYVVDEGDTILFDSSGSTDADGDFLEYRWDFDDDGTWDTAWVTSSMAPHSWPDDYSGDVKLEVFDGRMRDVDFTTVTVNNVAPSISPFLTDIDENDLSTLHVTIYDPGVLDTFDATIDWGDSNPTESYSYTVGTTSFTRTHQYLDDDPTGTPSDDYTVTVTVTDDDAGSDTEDYDVTVDNLDPVATIDDMDQPNPQFILPNQEITFYGSFTDVGTLDTHIYYWDFDDGDTSTLQNPTHSYSTHGDYTVTFTVTDDDTGTNTDTYAVHVADEFEALQDLDDYIQNVPDSDYKDKASNRKKAFSNKFNAIYNILEDEDYQKLIDKLNIDVRIKCDGLIDGDPLDDWIVEYNAQYHICMKIDDITTYLATL